MGRRTVCLPEPFPYTVMPGLVPGISLGRVSRMWGNRVDGRNKSGHDVWGVPSS